MRTFTLALELLTFAVQGTCVERVTQASCNTTLAHSEDMTFWEVPRRLRLALVRHGESENNVHEAMGQDEYRRLRSNDPHLSPRGHLQAERLAAFLTDTTRSQPILGIHPLSELWTSPTRRTMQTIAPLAAASGLQPLVQTQAFEAGGIFDADMSYTSITARGGMTRSQMLREFPAYRLPDDVTDDGWYNASGRETDEECRHRAASFAEMLRSYAAGLEASDRGNEQLVLVAHYDFLSALLDALILPKQVLPFCHSPLVSCVRAPADPARSLA